jgi:hypothetical protein
LRPDISILRGHGFTSRPIPAAGSMACHAGQGPTQGIAWPTPLSHAVGLESESGTCHARVGGGVVSRPKGGVGRAARTELTACLSSGQGARLPDDCGMRKGDCGSVCCGSTHPIASPIAIAIEISCPPSQDLGRWTVDVGPWTPSADGQASPHARHCASGRTMISSRRGPILGCVRGTPPG